MVKSWVLFTSLSESYVTPNFYTHTKPLPGKVVPTWFFSAVQIYGTRKVIHDTSDPATKAFLLRQTAELTQHGEWYLMDSSPTQAWRISDSPTEFTFRSYPATSRRHAFTMATSA
jgi:transcriptional regulator